MTTLKIHRERFPFVPSTSGLKHSLVKCNIPGLEERSNPFIIIETRADGLKITPQQQVDCMQTQTDSVDKRARTGILKLMFVLHCGYEVEENFDKQSSAMRYAIRNAVDGYRTTCLLKRQIRMRMVVKC